MNKENNHTQTSLAGGEISEEEKLFRAKKSEMQKKYRMMSGTLVAVIVVAIILYVSSSNGNSPENNVVAGTEATNNTATMQQTTSVDFAISQSSVYFSRVGDFAELTANVNGVQWSTNNPNVVSVSDNGCVTALNGGTAEVYAKYNDTIKVCTVTVDTYIPTEDEIAEANRQLQIVEDYEAQYTTYSFAEVKTMFDSYINAGNSVAIGSWVMVKNLGDAHVISYHAGWYHNLAVDYYDASNTHVYRDEYTIVKADERFFPNSPTYSNWIVSSVHNQLFTINTDKSLYYCYHNPSDVGISWLLYGAEYVDSIATKTLIIADNLS